MKTHQQIFDDLALYALRELPAAEAEETRRHIEECPQCRRELNEINSDLAVVALSSVASAPPQRTRERLMKAIKTEPRPTSGLIMRRRPWWSFAPLFALVLLVAFGLMLWRDNASLRRRLEASEQREHSQAADLERASMVLEALTAPWSTHYALVANKASRVPQGRASYMQKTGTIVFTAQNLAALPDQKTYELWLVPANGSKPMPCGTFKPDAHGDASLVMPKSNMKTMPKTFAVTVEPDGGSQTPTMPMVMAGD
ncbi:MAG TPA: anti-sigma factor [Terriglobales bacterium]|nr:anti-sigma factor [Terriglobales bacterium]